MLTQTFLQITKECASRSSDNNVYGGSYTYVYIILSIMIYKHTHTHIHTHTHTHTRIYIAGDHNAIVFNKNVNKTEIKNLRRNIICIKIL